MNKEIIDRILHIMSVLEFKTQGDFADVIKVNRSNFSQMMQGKRVIGDAIINKISLHLNISTDWLKAGNGLMFKENTEKPFRNEVTPVPEGDYMMVEYADLRASAGRLGGSDISQLPETHKRLVPKEYAKGGFLVIRVDGDSMDDGTKRSLSDGDEVLVYEKTDNHIEDLPIKKTLFVITSRDGNVLKQIKEINKEEGYIICHSFNPRYEDYKMNISDIFQIFVVCKVVQKQISLI